MTKLVFETLRVGFPTAKVTVFGNSLCGDALEYIKTICAAGGYTYHDTNTIHHKWIKELYESETEPFYVVDTDIIFYESVELWQYDKPLAGWRIPEWNDEFSGSVTRARLHGSLLYINPIKIQEAISEYNSQFPNSEFIPMADLFYPICLPFKGRGYFYDTCGLLYHAIGGQPFTEKQLDAYFHFNFGTISDVVLPRLSCGEEMVKAREYMMNNKHLGKGAWRKQMEYYAARQS